jgi:predicted enzyme related to lactoylglutathione lyase
MITGVRKVVVPVDDQAEAKQFWTSKVGFEVVCDEPMGADQRWIEVAPADRSIVLVLSRRHPDDTRAAAPDTLPHSPVFFNADDIQQTYQELASRGVAFAAPPARLPFGWWAMFEDHEGTRYALGQW